VGGNISPSATEVLSGNKILETCKNPDEIAQGICIGYVSGAEQNLASILAITNVTTGQKQDIFIQYLKNNPKDRHKMAFLLFVGSMKEAYPCPK
jgi:hypothetical protein